MPKKPSCVAVYSAANTAPNTNPPRLLASWVIENGVYIRLIPDGMKSENLTLTDRADRKFVRGTIVGSANGSVRCKESPFHPFVLTVYLFQNTFRQCNGCSAGGIQLVNMMCLAHGDIVCGELVHDFSQILVESGEDADSQAEVGRPKECFSPFRAELLDFFAMLRHPSGTARYQFHTGFERFHIIAVSYHRIGKLNGHIGRFERFRFEVILIIDINDADDFMSATTGNLSISLPIFP